jgi:hypothetical protein
VDLSHAPVPTNDSERLVFRQLYRNLVRIDCQGVVHPELAESWAYDKASRSWRFVLRDTAGSTGDGSRLVAGQVLAAWRGHPRLLGAMGIDSVVATDARTLIIGVRDTTGEPKLFAQAALSVGLGPGLSLASNGRFLKPAGRGPAVLDFISVPGDLRDVLDSGADLLVTRDVGLAEYAAGHRDLQTFPLPWSRTYVLVQPAAADSLPGVADADQLRTSLARDAVKADARPAPGSWSPPACGRSGTPAQSTRPLPRVVYLAGDPVARGLAERIVGLSGSDSDLRAVPLADSALAASLRSGRERGYILALSPNPQDFCSFGLPIPADASVYSLIETRARAIMRRGSPELTSDWDGTLRLAEPLEPTDRP